MIELKQCAELIGALLFKYDIYYTADEIENVLACIPDNVLDHYLTDIGIYMTNDKITVSSINNDKQWIRLKVHMLWRRLMELADG